MPQPFGGTVRLPGSLTPSFQTFYDRNYVSKSDGRCNKTGDGIVEIEHC